MKKLLFLLVFIFISSSSFSQIIVHKEIIKGKKLVMVKSTGEIRTNDKIIIEKFNITEIQDEFIEIKLGSSRHLLSTTEYKNVSINASSNKKRWNVYDGDKLIYLKREFDVLNYFNKYGFEYYKRKFTGKGKKYIILKNNNN
tara:strand:- start:26 stop:451 length:426 start_codon:yes stop_codon:yes gene_type:complete